VIFSQGRLTVRCRPPPFFARQSQRLFPSFYPRQPRTVRSDEALLVSVTHFINSDPCALLPTDESLEHRYYCCHFTPYSIRSGAHTSAAAREHSSASVSIVMPLFFPLVCFIVVLFTSGCKRLSPETRRMFSQYLRL
jgi:hypothetical protein